MKPDEKAVRMRQGVDPELDLLERLLRLAGSRPAAPTDLETRVKSTVHAHWVRASRQRRLRKRFFWAASTAAACLVLYLLAYQFILASPLPSVPVGVVAYRKGDVHHSKPDHLHTGFVLTEDSEVQTSQNGQLFIRLLGGTTIRLDVNSVVVFKSNSIFQLKQGAVYVDAGPSSKMVFVQTSLGDVRDEGTQFEVRVSDSSLRVRVREGAVIVKNGSFSQRAPAGTELMVSPSGNSSTQKISRYGQEWHWVSNLPSTFALEGRTLSEFLNWITRENGWNIQYTNQGAAHQARSTYLHGSVANLKAEEMLAAVIPVTGATYSLKDGTLLIRFEPKE